jgi:DNA-binding NtrC family response regulator
LDAETLQRSITEAKGTTLLIEDVDQMPAPAQQILVRFLKERGSRLTTDGAPARIIATTSAHMPELVARGAFREDLYYRLHSYPIVVPSLKERTEDITLLAESILQQLSGSMSQRPAGFTPSGRTMLESMPWPGNVAQLENVVRRAFLQAGGAAIDERHLSLPALAAAPVVSAAIAASSAAAVAEDVEAEVDEDSIRPFEDEEKVLLSRALRATRGNVRRAAQLLGIGRATLYRKIQQFKLRLQ